MESLSGPNPGVLLALYAFIFLIPSGDVWAHPRGASKSSVPEVLQDSDLPGSLLRGESRAELAT